MKMNHEILLVTKTYWGGFFPLLYQKENQIVIENFVRQDTQIEKNPENERNISQDSCTLMTQFSVELGYQHNVMELSCGVAHLLLSTRSQWVMAMGYNSYNQLGVSCTDIFLASELMNITNTMIQEPLEIQSVTAGPYQSFIVFQKKNNSFSNVQNNKTTTVFSFGKNNVGQLGHGDCSEHSLAPRQVFLPNETFVTTLVAGYYHTLALTKNYKVFAWGCNQKNQLGPTTLHTFSNPIPFEIPLSSMQGKEDRITDAVASLWHSFFIVNSQKIYQLGSTCTLSCFILDFPPLKKDTKNKVGAWQVLQVSYIDTSNQSDSCDSTVTETNTTPIRVPMFPLVAQGKIITMASNALLHCVITENHLKDTLSVVYWCEYSEVCYILHIATKHYTSVQPRHLHGQSPCDVPNYEHLLESPKTYIIQSRKLRKTSCCIAKEALYIFILTS